ncbi:MAG: hypothetical protein ACJA0S_001227 [Rickettsiales bacterium]|jgi:hypothetical protein
MFLFGNYFLRRFFFVGLWNLIYQNYKREIILVFNKQKVAIANDDQQIGIVWNCEYLKNYFG